MRTLRLTRRVVETLSLKINAPLLDPTYERGGVIPLAYSTIHRVYSVISSCGSFDFLLNFFFALVQDNNIYILIENPTCYHQHKKES